VPATSALSLGEKRSVTRWPTSRRYGTHCRIGMRVFCDWRPIEPCCEPIADSGDSRTSQRRTLVATARLLPPARCGQTARRVCLQDSRSGSWFVVSSAAVEPVHG
jgi:hypothetical protein